MRVAVMGCVVNGPGESKHATSASACRAPSRSRSPRYSSTASSTDPRGEAIVHEFLAILDDYVETRFGPSATS